MGDRLLSVLLLLFNLWKIPRCPHNQVFHNVEPSGWRSLLRQPVFTSLTHRLNSRASPLRGLPRQPFRISGKFPWRPAIASFQEWTDSSLKTWLESFSTFTSGHQAQRLALWWASKRLAKWVRNWACKWLPVKAIPPSFCSCFGKKNTDSRREWLR